MNDAELPPVVAIDGPAGAGKSTIAALISKRFDYHLLISGSLYRALALLTFETDLDASNVHSLIGHLPRMRVRFTPDADSVRVHLNKRDVTRLMSSEDCAAVASRIAQMPALRTALLQYQRDFRRSPGLVAEGRDMGTVVFPDVRLKVFLTAELEERARRRLKQLNDRGLSGNLAHLYQQLAVRDESDKSRPVAPLKPAPDATIIDTTGKSIDTVATEIGSLVNYYYA